MAEIMTPFTEKKSIIPIMPICFGIFSGIIVLQVFIDGTKFRLVGSRATNTEHPWVSSTRL